MAAVDAQSLITDANSYQAIASRMVALRIIIWELQQISGLNAMTAQQLIAAANPYQIVQSESTANNIMIYLLGQILINGGTTGGASVIAAGNYAGSQPSFTPTSAGAAAIDTSNGRLWLWYNSAWH